MGTAQKFEDLEIWKRAREICKKVHLIQGKTDLKKDFKLYNQLNGSSGSIMDNIAEGFERNGNKEFCQFLSIAKASCGETRSQFYRVLDRDYISKEEFDNLVEKLTSLSKQINSFMKYLKDSGFRGSKFSKEL
ncbi:four helix bundle protein [Antarcticibacterium sp. 1MA-6-2]|uniref:four helix bundle protein n=1 Tax=Antarcticibacterium sp. 1MA-6-2 TaxID=2908210 RepID=UPI001F411E3E|nr:four helix bundle protein [Antarcticibacterium sp. 1MA-6-2]UJH89988.1 four helix bundle protein [Antarcticibacterium sp. 1MA-6-2]